MRRRIAVLFEHPTLNGGERSLLAAAARLTDRFEFVALAPSAGRLADALADAGIEVVPSPLFDADGGRRPRPEAVERLADAAHAVAAGLLHGNSLAAGRYTGAAAVRLLIPCTAHLRDIVGLSAAAVRDLNANRRLIAVSHATRDFHVAQGLDPTRVTVVHNGVDLDRFRPRDRDDATRRELAVPRDAPLLLTVGQIGLRKGWDVLADAADLFGQRFPDLHLVLAGERYSDKPETVAYEQSVRDRLAAALPGRAHFTGYRPDMPALMAAADILVHPARQEPFGRVLLEAAAAGLPVVATAVGGTEEIFADGVTARLVPPGDAAALAGGVLDLLNAPGSRRRLAAAARRRVETEFSAAAAAARLASVWQATTDLGRSPDPPRRPPSSE